MAKVNLKWLNNCCCALQATDGSAPLNTRVWDRFNSWSDGAVADWFPSPVNFLMLLLWWASPIRPFNQVMDPR